MALIPPSGCKKRFLLQTSGYDSDDSYETENGNDVVNRKTNLNSCKKRCKSEVLYPTIILDDESATLQDQTQIVKDRSAKGVAHQRHAGMSLLRTVLLRDGPRASQISSGLREFEFPESQIRFIDIIGTGDHSIVFRITAGGRNFALKIHMYEPDTVLDPKYPKSNIFFDRESTAYTRLSHLQTETHPLIPKCYGHVNLTKPPQRQGRRLRHLFRSTAFRPAVYLDFISRKTNEEGTEDETLGDEVEEDPRWMEYFRNKSRRCILRGLVLEEVAGRTLCYADVSNRLLAQSGQEALQRIHAAGVLHGDVKNALGNVYVTMTPDEAKEERIVWIDFSMAESSSDMDKRTFAKKALVEIRLWSGMFAN